MSDPRIEQAALSAARTVLDAFDARPATYLVGIAGIGGSGKSTLCTAIRGLRPEIVVIPMDGYHLPRAALDAAALARRGAIHTFDATAFRRDIKALKRSNVGVFPSFDHAEQDPRPEAIHVGPDVPMVIVEGLYVLCRAWELEPLFDLTVFVDCDPAAALERVAARHLAAGLAATPEAAWRRAASNDRLNAEAILADGCRERADLVVPSHRCV